jgi:RNA polymerase-binding transcription factor DksA
MKNSFFKKAKERLEKEKLSIETELKKFAKEDKNLKGDWDTRFPKFNGSEAGGAALEKAADEVEEYVNLLPIEHSLELRLKNINLALEKIEKGKYGICENCGEKIPTERLEVHPEARFCLKCNQK